jgi:hypothetical protein
MSYEIQQILMQNKLDPFVLDPKKNDYSPRRGWSYSCSI